MSEGVKIDGYIYLMKRGDFDEYVIFLFAVMIMSLYWSGLQSTLDRCLLFFRPMLLNLYLRISIIPLPEISQHISKFYKPQYNRAIKP